ncbi:MFS polyamine transporter [Cristinia sonorae]|uniref:MFS polyamine transporter n=1 Tax=Cristinia sonorae TaxID=1940300 RepID=A0A8K0UTK7_9AGAR|nr:MFS polyamine transporter [Cristinia sonorae]
MQTHSSSRQMSPTPTLHDQPEKALHDDRASETTHIDSSANVVPDPHTDDPIIVDWDGPNDPENPKNWTFKHKWAATAIVSAFTFISPVSSSMSAPASSRIAEQFGVHSTVVIEMMVSAFVLAYAFGPLFLGPLSEIFGRSRVLQLANLWYLVWNLACGFAQNSGELIAFRFLAGLGGSAPLAVGGGVIGDCWAPEQRGKAIALYSLAPLFGPVIGPIAGAWIAQRTTWRWVFWSTTMVDTLIQVLGMFFLQETFAPILLARKAEKLRKDMDPEKANIRKIRTIYDTDERHWRNIMAKALLRPFALFIYEPIIQLFGLYLAFVYGVLYLFLTTIPSIFEDVYHEETGIAGLHYLSFGLGLMLGAQLNMRFLDRIYKYLKGKNDGVGRPEFRLPTMLPGVICLPIGLLISGWTARADVPWIAVDIGMFLIGVGIILNFQGIQTYVVDAFTLHAASALAAVAFLRSLCGFGFPLFAPSMYKALGFGKGNTILACVAIAIGCPAPILFWKYGERIRKASRYAVA